MICYVITISQQFPSYHVKKGIETNFIEKIEKQEKIHTIRANYEWWFKRIQKVKLGEAYLSLRYWSGKPYRSKQKEFKKIYNADIQKLSTNNQGVLLIDNQKTNNTIQKIANNDGLSLLDFLGWFKGNFKDEKAIIHFTNFKYVV